MALPVFIDLHLHSQYSLLDGVNSPLEMVQKAKSFGAPAVALTEHGTLASIFEFSDACQKEGVKPLFGCELYFKEQLHDKNPNLKFFHGVFLAKNKIGLQNLFRLSSLGYRPDHFEFNRPVVSFVDIEKYSEGLIYSTGCVDGIVGASHNLPYSEVVRLINIFIPIFKGRMFFEINPANVDTDWVSKERVFKTRPVVSKEFGTSMYTTNDMQQDHNRRVLLLAQQYQLPIVIGSDGHMTDPSFKPVQDLLIKSSPTNSNGWHFDHIYSMMSNEELFNKFQANHNYIVPELIVWALNNNIELANSIEDIKLQYPALVPKYPLDTHPSYKPGMTSKDLLLQIILDKNRMLWVPEYTNRLKYEIKVICDNGIVDYSDYFLILADMVGYARANKIGVGPGRGSGGGSLLAYLMGITAINPLTYNLDFTRFLNEGRLKAGHMPDLDLDFSDRDKIIAYLFSKYGEDHMAAVGSFQTIKTKAALRDIVRYVKYNGKLPNSDPVHKVCKSIDTVKQAYPDEHAFLYGYTDDDDVFHPGQIEQNSVLREYLRSNQTINDIDIVDMLNKILQKPRYASKHAGGVVITTQPIDDVIPTRYYKECKCTQIDFKTLEKIGGMKIDILRIDTLSFIYDSLDLILKNHGIQLDPWGLPQDPKVFKSVFATGNTETVFQFDTHVVRPFLKKLHPKSIEELSVITAIGRPGPLDSKLEDGKSVADHYTQRKLNQEPVKYIDSLLETILKETLGLCVYQEQISKIFEVIGGFTSIESDDARRAIGKKDLKLLLSIKGKLFEGAQKLHGWSLDKCEELWNSFSGAAEYAFNKAHSVSYSVIAYACAYLKYHYPLEWWASVLSNIDAEKARDKNYISTIKDFIVMPDINLSNHRWIIKDNKIIAPLSYIRGIGTTVIDEIAKAREVGSFTSFDDFYLRVNKTKVHKTVMANLIVAGCFEGIPILSTDKECPQTHVLMTHLNQLKDGSLLDTYMNLDNRIKYLALRSLILPISFNNYLVSFKDIVMSLTHHEFYDGQHHINGLKIIEDFDSFESADNTMVAVMGLITEAEIFKYNNKKTGEQQSALKVTIENDSKSIKTIVWPNKLTQAIKQDFKAGNLMMLAGYVQEDSYSNGFMIDFTSYKLLLQGDINVFELKKE